MNDPTEGFDSISRN